MTKKILLSVALCLFLCVGAHTYTYAQVKSKEKTSDKFTKEEKEKFSVIYEYALSNSFDATKAILENYKKITIPEKRFGEIFSAQFGGKAVELTPTEKIEMDKFTELMKKDKQANDDQVNKIVLAQKLDQKKYQEMKKEYSQNHIFQNEIYEITQKRQIINSKK